VPKQKPHREAGLSRQLEQGVPVRRQTHHLNATDASSVAQGAQTKAPPQGSGANFRAFPAPTGCAEPTRSAPKKAHPRDGHHIQIRWAA